MQVEFILMGGTFMSLPLDYRDYFVRNLHDALSGHSSSNVAEAVRFSEQSRTRCIGLTIETRPDYCLTPHLTQVKDLLASAGRYAVHEMHMKRMLQCTECCKVWSTLRNVHSKPFVCQSYGFATAFDICPLGNPGYGKLWTCSALLLALA